ncbi:hypothetical protein J7337_007818 [Fusarium musae]|uniref:Uncharacterized protein n=1 Tax=Fusarium musae TaxID=1042133 RepID=A0A9P8IQM1_9HYPO|nr:hypothetical protein J7337_007818 [Fusarium musae]KAG9502102.1 hypothetical protein J7337_007818 [Fusarium musae]
MHSIDYKQKVREALQASLPVATEQLMTVQIPGTIIDTTPKMGVTGKSVSRSYAAALDMLIPEDAPIETDKSTATKTAAADRYVAAMRYLTSTAPNSSKSVIDVYVEKQQAYSEAMNKWEAAKAKARSDAKERFPGNVKEQQRFYDDWNQETFRNVDYYFGIVDVSSAMKRVESSKEAARNLVVIDPDGSTEWQEVHLTPANWATLCKEKVDQWQAQNGQLSRKDFESEIKRLNRLLLSYEGLKNATHASVDPDETIRKQIKAAATTQNGTENKTEGTSDGNTEGGSEGSKSIDKAAADTEGKLTKAYKELYDAQNAFPPDPLVTRAKQDQLQDALEENGKENLQKNKDLASKLSNKSKKEKVLWINSMIADVNSQLELLKKGLEEFHKASTSAPAITEIINRDVKDPGQDNGGELISTQYAEADGQYADPSQCILKSVTRRILTMDL